MRPRFVLVALALLTLGCGDAGEQPPPPAEPVQSRAEPAPAQFSRPLPGSDRTNPAELMRYWSGAVEAGDTDAARRAWRREIRTGGTAPRWANLSGITVTFGEGKEEGAAGSIFYAVPVTLYGRSIDGQDIVLGGTMTLRRANDVPGADEDQLSWRIASIDWDG